MPNTVRNTTAGPRTLRRWFTTAAATFAALAMSAGSHPTAAPTAVALKPASYTTASTSATQTNGYMVAFGDSVASGYRCYCTPFPVQYANKVGANVGRRVTMTNYAFGGAVASDVMKQLSTAQVQGAVRRSGTALVMIGANDFGRPLQDVLAHRKTAATAFPPVANRVQSTVTAEIQKIKQLHPGIRVVVAGYWNVAKDGNVGLRTYGAWGEAQAVKGTLYADAGLYKAAVATGSTYVSTYYPFKGYDGKSNPTWLLAADGDHPNATGHRVIANAFYRAAPRG